MNTLLYWIYVRATELLQVAQQQLAEQQRTNVLQEQLLAAQQQAVVLQAQLLAVEAQEVAILQEVKRRLPGPKPGYLTIEGMRQMPNARFQFDVGLPAITDPNDDTVVRRLSIAINGGAPTVREHSRDDAKSDDVAGPDGQEEGSAFEFALTDYDSAGNPSETSALTFMLTDTVGPPKPGELSVLNMRQLPTPPEPTPEPTP